MKRFEFNLTTNPTFNTVTGLTNTTFDPNDIVSGRGATEDQLKVIGDSVQIINDYLDEFGCSDCDEQYAGIRNILNSLQVAQEECCDNRATQENIDALVAELRSKLNYLEARIEECCASNSCYDGGGNIPSSACDGSEVTVAMTWGLDPATDGGQVTASSSGGSPISYYFFLVKSVSNVWIPKTTVNYLDKEYSIDKTTGKISIVTASGAGHQACAILAQDANGCEGVGVFVPPT